MNAISKCRCHICNSRNTIQIEHYADFKKVTSDCKPFESSANLLFCTQCHAIQKCIDENYLADTERIYNGYTAYYQSGGKEQIVFSREQNGIKSRSSAILEAIKESIPITSKGRFLDIGCANGNMIETFGNVFPDWDLFGFDISEEKRKDIEAIKNVKQYYSKHLSNIHGSYDIISIIHVLEHVPDPCTYLTAIRDLLEPQGILIIETPDIMENPFDLLIADHCTHFSKTRLIKLLEDAGFKIVLPIAQAIPKELTIVATPCRQLIEKDEFISDENLLLYIHHCVSWLQRILDMVKEGCRYEHIGIFGAGIASVWLISEFRGLITFCVDEDKNKIGHMYCGIPVLDPDEIKDKIVFVPMPYKISKNIASRFSGRKGCQYIATPEPASVFL